MDQIAAIRENFSIARMIAEGTIDGVSAEQMQHVPAGTAHPVGATYHHLISGEDHFVQALLQGKPPLAATTFAGKTGVSEPSPRSEDWGEWARTVKIDPQALRAYAQAVYAATDAYLAGLKPEDLDRKVQLPFEFNGTTEATVGMALTLCVSHENNHIGEIAAIKGIQGLRGYPF